MRAEVEVLDRDRDGVLVDQLAHARVDFREAPLERQAPAGVSITPPSSASRRPRVGDDAVAGAGRARVDAEDDHMFGILRGEAGRLPAPHAAETARPATERQATVPRAGVGAPARMRVGPRATPAASGRRRCAGRREPAARARRIVRADAVGALRGSSHASADPLVWLTATQPSRAH